jgi:hypothetical protein
MRTHVSGDYNHDHDGPYEVWYLAKEGVKFVPSPFQTFAFAFT